jgi:thiamine pyrophosphate-dependent acetolactate synthase large subunit-like protein
MKVFNAIGEILKREGVELITGYPVNHIIEGAAAAGVRPIIVRQERTGLHMADAISRTTSGKKLGVFVMQHGPGSENAFGGVAQAFGDSVPMVVLPMGFPRNLQNISPNFSSLLNFQHVTKWVEQVSLADQVPNALRRAFTQARNGRPRPTMVEIPSDIMTADIADDFHYVPTSHIKVGPDPDLVRRAAEVLVAAERPVIYAGQGVHYAEAWAQLKELAELLEAPVTTSIQGKSAFPEDHPLSLGCAGRSLPKAAWDFIQNSDVIFGIGCSFSSTNYGTTMPKGKTIIHATLDSLDLNKDIESQHQILGDAGLILDALLLEVKDRLKNKSRGRGDGIAAKIAELNTQWIEDWTPKLTDTSTPINPYRVIWDLLHTVDVPNTIMTHDAGSPRDQIVPFWKPTAPLSYIGWGKTTQLGYGLGLAMGAKLAHPDKLCVNFWGDAAIGFTGMDFETAARERIPILSCLMNNFSMAIELKVMPVSTEKYRSTDISGNYADMAKAFGCYGERITDPNDIIPAIKRGIKQTQEGKPALLEFLTQKETNISTF